MEARFVTVTGHLHAPAEVSTPLVSWQLDVGFIDSWRPLYPVILGNVRFIDEFTVTVNRFAQATAIEPRDRFDQLFGMAPAFGS